MSDKFDIDGMLRREWRELGFYYCFDHSVNEWKLYGARHAIQNFGNIIKDYCDAPENAGLSEHLHLGPYSYLKITTWDRPSISRAGIGGTMDDLKKLANLISTKSSAAAPGETIVIDKEFGSQNEARIIMKIMPEDFDPVSMDSDLKEWSKKYTD